MNKFQILISALEARSRWSNLRTLGQSNLVRATVLMPVFGYLLLFNDTVQQLTMRFESGLVIQLPSMWRIYFLYYGSFLLAVGALLFARQCPEDIKNYAAHYKMVDAERDHLVAHNQQHQIANQVKALYADMSEWEKSIFDLPRLDPTLPNLGAGGVVQTSDQWGLGLIHIWSIENLKQPTLRIIVYLLFRVGLLLVAIPACVTFLQVTWFLLKRLAS